MSQKSGRSSACRQAGEDGALRLITDFGSAELHTSLGERQDDSALGFLLSQSRPYAPYGAGGHAEARPGRMPLDGGRALPWGWASDPGRGDPQAQDGGRKQRSLCSESLMRWLCEAGRRHGARGARLPLPGLMEAQAFQAFILTSVPSKLGPVAGCSHPSREPAQTAASDETQPAGPGQ